MLNPLEEKEYLLYFELHHILLTSRIAYNNFLATAKQQNNDWLNLYFQGGAYKLPGWSKYVTEFAFPLNDKIKQVIFKIYELEKSRGKNLPPSLKEFLLYVNNWHILHLAYVRGDNPGYNWTAGRNFPEGLDEYVESALIKFSGVPSVKH